MEKFYGDCDLKNFDYLNFAERFRVSIFSNFAVCCNETETTSGLQELINLRASFVVFVLLFHKYICITKCEQMRGV